MEKDQILCPQGQAQAQHEQRGNHHLTNHPKILPDHWCPPRKYRLVIAGCIFRATRWASK
ncbi:MAG: hypothetical protein OZSIB_1107 [Candidatus Ozemobacter sibiricus]|uniref:Uncharacterized protein n=1 Tax=Candidatus Ozemobacter sibiricus TaxID=2268124 RepID=A0A367ZKY4_9BACT|nr:MAG: hypothetical protein OZSIB_1107 [Candidatus Ozemobacter sibiricus]